MRETLQNLLCCAEYGARAHWSGDTSGTERKGRSKAGVQLSVSGRTEFSAVILSKHK